VVSRLFPPSRKYSSKSEQETSSVMFQTCFNTTQPLSLQSLDSYTSLDACGACGIIIMYMKNHERSNRQC
jgi:hypothetical protein